MTKCSKCNHDCHCNGDLHADEYGTCACENCECKSKAEDLSYENEQSMVTIPLKEYDKLKEQNKYITDATLISAIDKIEFFVKELRKHIVRKL